MFPEEEMTEHPYESYMDIMLESRNMHQFSEPGIK
jgi:hypothetical protein